MSAGMLRSWGRTLAPQFIDGLIRRSGGPRPAAGLALVRRDAQLRRRRRRSPMRALAAFPGRRELRIIEVPAPVRRSERDVLVRIREVGICGTDRDIAGFQYGAPAPGTDRLVLGHEAFGEVVEVGTSVRTLAPGDLVALTVRRPCDDAACPACRAGRQ